jgi:dTDP-glucose 4,6-dehydratase
MKRVLMTGGGGFMGSHVLRHILLNTDWHVVILDSFRHKGKTSRLNVQMEGIEDAAKRVTVITHDLKAPIDKQMKERIGDINYILNIASESHVDRSITDPRDFIENNVALMLTMLEYARSIYGEYSDGSSAPLEKFIQISTDEVYGPAPEGHAHKEGEPHKPSNPYSASKSAQEAICFSFWRTYQLPIIITNTMNIIGELQDPEKYIPMVIQKVNAGETVTIHGNADGTQIGSRFYLHARNQADALLFILNNIKPDKFGEAVAYEGDWEEGFTQTQATEPTTFNIVGEKETDNLELAQLVAKFVGKELKYKIVDFHSSRPGHDLRYALDGSKLAAAGWTPPFTFEDSLETTVKWTIQHPEWLLDD